MVHRIRLAISMLAFCLPLAAWAQSPRSFTATTPDGVRIAVQEWGNPAGPEILFIHGFAQSHLTWMRQVGAPELANDFRLITYDLRGHGQSDKPSERDRYQSGKLWADEVNAVIEAAQLRRPVIVAWSYGGRVVSDYLVNYGSAHLAGVNFVDAVTNGKPEYFGTAVFPFLRGMASPDLATNIASTIAFLHACFVTQPSEEEFQTMLAFNMVVSPQVRANMGGRSLDIADMLAGLRLPVLVTHGEQDQIDLPSLAQYTVGIVPGAKLSMIPGVGHASFYEAALRFNRELAEFVRDANAAPPR